jgi:stalled ribosome alternative rescue factor ArfA
MEEKIKLEEKEIRKGHLFVLNTATKTHKPKKGKGSYNRKDAKKGGGEVVDLAKLPTTSPVGWG